MIGVVSMKKPTIIISMPKNSTKEDIASVRKYYSEQYKVHIIISGNEDAKEVIQNFLMEGITK
jgi:hypothetical protein